LLVADGVGSRGGVKGGPRGRDEEVDAVAPIGAGDGLCSRCRGDEEGLYPRAEEGAAILDPPVGGLGDEGPERSPDRYGLGVEGGAAEHGQGAASR